MDEIFIARPLSSIRKNGASKKALQNEQGLLFFQAYYLLGLEGDYVGRAGAFFALSDFELHLLAFVERCIARCLNIRVMDKKIFATVVRVDKTKSLT
jgi:hypothetical protein